MSATTAPRISSTFLEIDPDHQNNATTRDNDREAVAAMELDRGYHAFETESYFLPNDATEHRRLDLQDHIWKIAMNGGLHVAPISDDVQDVVDIGTGTGSWALDFARAHPQSQVVGTDLSPVAQSDDTIVLPNIRFVVANASEEWDFDGRQMDFIHSRLLTLGIRNWDHYFEQCFKHLKPGGWMELFETRFPFGFVSSPNNIQHDHGIVESSHTKHGSSESVCMAEKEKVLSSKLYQFTRMIRDVSAKRGVDVQASDRFPDMLQQKGFVNVRNEQIRAAVGMWPTSSLNKEIGRLIKVNLSDFFIPALAVKICATTYGWDHERVGEYVEEIRQELDRGEHHFYCVCRIFCAQKPAT